MSQREINRKFDEIVAFAEIEKFLDTPVKRYSSGMYVRLAFAVAAHLEPEILMVDEVWRSATAVSEEMPGQDGPDRQGRLYRSLRQPSDEAVQRLCRQCLLDRKGLCQIVRGKDDIIAGYLSDDDGRIQPGQWIDLTMFLGGAVRRPDSAKCGSVVPDSMIADQPYPDGPLEVELSVVSDAVRRIDSLAVNFADLHGTRLVNTDTLSLGETIVLKPGTTNLVIKIEQLHLNPGQYILGLWLASGGAAYDQLMDAGIIEVADPPSAKFGKRPANDGVVTSRFSVSVSPRVEKAYGIVGPEELERLHGESVSKVCR